jgi:molybdate transport system regulatory protein
MLYPATEVAEMGLRVRSKIWIENEEGKLVIGTGRLRILEAIRKVGSMNKAAQMLNQPFRAVWGKIRATEERCGFSLVERSSGGSRLTERGMQLLNSYIQLREGCEQFADTRFRELFREGKAKNLPDAPDDGNRPHDPER